MKNLELIHARPLGRTDYFEVLVTYEEFIGTPASYLRITVEPLVHYEPCDDRVFVSNVERDQTPYSFDLLLNHQNQTAQFGIDRDVVTPPCLQGAGVGSYAFIKLIEWANANGPNYKIADLKLGRGDAQTEAARKLRNEFYSSLGFKLHFEFDQSQSSGHCSAKSFADLGKEINRKKIIQCFEVQDRLRKLILENDKQHSNIAQLEQRLGNKTAEIKKLKRFRITVIFGLVLTAIIALGVIRYKFGS
jgi:hypothetical protein